MNQKLADKLIELQEKINTELNRLSRNGIEVQKALRGSMEETSRLKELVKEAYMEGVADGSLLHDNDWENSWCKAELDGNNNTL